MDPWLVVIIFGILVVLIGLIVIGVLSSKPAKKPIVHRGKKYVTLQQQGVQPIVERRKSHREKSASVTRVTTSTPSSGSQTQTDTTTPSSMTLQQLLAMTAGTPLQQNHNDTRDDCLPNALDQSSSAQPAQNCETSDQSSSSTSNSDSHSSSNSDSSSSSSSSDSSSSGSSGE